MDEQTRDHERDTRPGIAANEQVNYEYRLSLAKRARMFQKEVRKGPHWYSMEEKAYWDAFMSYTAELFSDAPAEQARWLHVARAFRAWYYLGKHAEAHPNTKEAAAYRMYDEAHNQCLDRVEQLIESRQAGLIDMEEFRAQAERAGARQRAVIALTNAFVPLERLRMTGEMLQLEQMTRDADS